MNVCTTKGMKQEKMAKLKEFRQLYESQTGGKTTGSGHFPVCSDHYQRWSEGAEACPGGAKQLKKLKLLLISARGLTPLPPYEPGQGYFLLKGSFSC